MSSETVYNCTKSLGPALTESHGKHASCISRVLTSNTLFLLYKKPTTWRVVSTFLENANFMLKCFLNSFKFQLHFFFNFNNFLTFTYLGLILTVDVHYDNDWDGGGYFLPAFALWATSSFGVWITVSPLIRYLQSGRLDYQLSYQQLQGSHGVTRNSFDSYVSLHP